MSPESARSLFGGSHIARSLGRRENRWALAITAAVGIAVALASRFPFDPDLSLDLRASKSRASLVTYLGFGRTTEKGRILRDEARIVLGRPLPERFALEIEAASTDGTPRRLAVRAGATRRVVTLGETPTRHRFDVENPDGVRELALRVEGEPSPGPGVVVSVVRLDRSAP